MALLSSKLYVHLPPEGHGHVPNRHYFWFSPRALPLLPNSEMDPLVRFLREGKGASSGPASSRGLTKVTPSSRDQFPGMPPGQAL